MLGHLRDLLAWLHRDERGQWEQLAIPIIGSLFGGLFGGGGGGGQQQQRASALEEAQIRNQTRILDYLMGRRERLYDPLEEQEIIPRLSERMTSAPFYARRAMQQAANLRQPMRLM